MALIKTIEEIKEHLPVSIDMDFNNILPFIKVAERDYIIRIISKTQYDDLSAAYNVTTPTLTPAQTALLGRLQEAITAYAFYLWIPSGQLQIDDSGIRIATTDTIKTAFQWQIDELQKSVLKQAYSAMDDLLSFMEDNIADYTLWQASDAYTEFKDCFIQTTQRFTELYSALGNSRMNFLAIRSSMKKIEEFMILPNISQAYYDELKAQIKANTLTPANLKVIPFIQKAVASLTISRAIAEISASIEPNGIFMFSSLRSSIITNQKEPAVPYVLSKIEKSAKEDGMAYFEMLRQFLFDNISDYGTYAASSAYNSVTTDDTFQNDKNNTYFFGG